MWSTPTGMQPDTVDDLSDKIIEKQAGLVLFHFTLKLDTADSQDFKVPVNEPFQV